MRIVSVFNPFEIELDQQTCFHCRAVLIPSLRDCFTAGTSKTDQDRAVYYKCPLCHGRCQATIVSSVQRRMVADATMLRRALIDRPPPAGTPLQQLSEQQLRLALLMLQEEQRRAIGNQQRSARIVQLIGEVTRQQATCKINALAKVAGFAAVTPGPAAPEPSERAPGKQKGKQKKTDSAQAKKRPPTGTNARANGHAKPRAHEEQKKAPMSSGEWADVEADDDDDSVPGPLDVRGMPQQVDADSDSEELDGCADSSTAASAPHRTVPVMNGA